MVEFLLKELKKSTPDNLVVSSCLKRLSSLSKVYKEMFDMYLHDSISNGTLFWVLRIYPKVTEESVGRLRFILWTNQFIHYLNNLDNSKFNEVQIKKILNFYTQRSNR